jgi:hypothetical protein
MSDDWVLIQDFDAVDRGHSRPRWELQLLDAGETVALRETDPITENTSINYVPAEVVAEVAEHVE